jgi:hypothetical protein
MLLPTHDHIVTSGEIISDSPGRVAAWLNCGSPSTNKYNWTQPNGNPAKDLRILKVGGPNSRDDWRFMFSIQGPPDSEYPPDAWGSSVFNFHSVPNDLGWGSTSPSGVVDNSNPTSCVHFFFKSNHRYQTVLTAPYTPGQSTMQLLNATGYKNNVPGQMYGTMGTINKRDVFQWSTISGNQLNGVSGISVPISQTWPAGTIVQATGADGLTFALEYGPAAWVLPEIPVGAWHDYEVRIRFGRTDSADLGVRPGIVQLWVNGTLEIDFVGNILQRTNNYYLNPGHPYVAQWVDLYEGGNYMLLDPGRPVKGSWKHRQTIARVGEDFNECVNDVPFVNPARFFQSYGFLPSGTIYGVASTHIAGRDDFGRVRVNMLQNGTPYDVPRFDTAAFRYSSPVTPTGQAPTNQQLPQIVGANTEGATLGVTPGQWSSNAGTVSLAYQWRRCDTNGGTCGDILGAVGSSYKLTAADRGKTIRVVEAATNTIGSTPATSNATAVVNAPPTYTYRQWIDNVNGTEVDPGCVVSIDPFAAQTQRNIVIASIASGSDNQDTANAIVTDATKFGNGDEGRLRFKLFIPNGFTPLANVSVVSVLNALGAYDFTTKVIADIYITASKLLGCFSTAGVLHSLSVNNVGTTPLSVGTHTVEVSWKRNGYRTMWLDDIQQFSSSGLSGAFLSATPRQLKLGIDHYDATPTDPGISVSVSETQLALESLTALFTPTLGSLTKKAIVASLVTSPTFNKKSPKTVVASMPMTVVQQKKIKKTIGRTLTMSATLSAPKHKLAIARTLGLAATLANIKRVQKTELSDCLSLARSGRRLAFISLSLLATTSALVKLTTAKRSFQTGISNIVSLSQFATSANRPRTFDVPINFSPAMVKGQVLSETVASSLTLTAALRKKIRKTLSVSAVLQPVLHTKTVLTFRVSLILGVGVATVRRVVANRGTNVTMHMNPTLTIAERNYVPFLANLPLRVATTKKARKALRAILPLDLVQSPSGTRHVLLSRPVALQADMQDRFGKVIGLNVVLGFFRNVTTHRIAVMRLAQTLNLTTELTNPVHRIRRMATTLTFVMIVKPGALVFRTASKITTLVGATMRKG